MPRCFAPSLVAAALALAAQAHAEALLLAEEQASTGPRTRVLLGRRGGGGASGASEVAPASFAEVLDGKSSQDEEEIPMETAKRVEEELREIPRENVSDERAPGTEEIPMETAKRVEEELREIPRENVSDERAPGTEAPGPKAHEEAMQAPAEPTQAPAKATEEEDEDANQGSDEIQDQGVEEDRSRSSRSSVLSNPVDSPPGNVSPDRRSVNELGSDDE